LKTKKEEIKMKNINVNDCFAIAGAKSNSEKTKDDLKDVKDDVLEGIGNTADDAAESIGDTANDIAKKINKLIDKA
jgi:hypothetical protein